MSFLRLGTQCAVFDDEGRVLLSRREDIRRWNLPGGRLDYGEQVQLAAAREIREETGLEVTIEYPATIYYTYKLARLHILFRARVAGGEIRSRTDETLDNRFFSPLDLPPDMMNPQYVSHALAPQKMLPQITVYPWQKRQLWRVALGARWLKNLLRGKPEPRHARFNLHATATIIDQTGDHIMVVPEHGGWTLPRLICDGSSTPWVQLADMTRRYYSTVPTYYWIGLCQQINTNTLDFVFGFQDTDNTSLLGGARWWDIEGVPLTGIDAGILQRMPRDPVTSTVWIMAY